MKMGEAIGIFSNNVKGLQDENKRRKIFYYLMNMKDANVCMLQETHSTLKNEQYWRAEWGGKIYYAHGTSESRGVCTMIKNNANIDVHEQICDSEGRYLILICTIQEKKVVLVNVYGPNKDDPIFFENLQIAITQAEQEHNCDYKIAAGDFNLILNNELDEFGGKEEHSNKKSAKYVNGWIDIWRVMHPNVRKYTYHQLRPTKVFTRLDFFLISLGMSGFIEKSDIKSGYCTDHSAVIISLNMQNNPRGPGFWKMNRSLLEDIDYVEMIKKVIKETTDLNEGANPQLMWETVKDQIRGNTIRYSARKKKNRERVMKECEKEMQNLEKSLDSDPHNDEIIKRLTSVKKTLDDIVEEKTKGSKIRCKVRWYEEGEKSTKYFLSLEKRNYNNKIVSRLKTSENKLITDKEEILLEQKKYYEKLYSSKIKENQEESITAPFLGQETPRLSNVEKENLEGKISEEEILTALKSFQNGKSPGSDGLTPEFYKVFWIDIKHLLVESINYAYEQGQMSIVQRHGLISLLPKKGKDPLFLKNWRPISLLNTDYKLATKSIASRLKTVLPKLIHNDQTGFLKGRYIGENINRILSLMEMADERDIPALMILIDFEKAFDSLEWSFIEKTLKQFNFGSSILNWVKTFYKNSTSSIVNNGWATPMFKLERGVRQGCPLSPYLFILAAEILANAIRENKDIKGIKIDGFTHKLSQYADDTTLFLELDRPSINTAFSIFRKFQDIAGLKINIEKTEIFPIGSIKNEEEVLYTDENIKWSHNGVKVLGINISHNHNELMSTNYNPILNKMENIVKIWSMRDLTLYGKATVVKTFIQSQLVYQLSVLPSPSKLFHKKVEKLIFKYLWNNKPDKIKRSVMYSKRENGGIGIPNIEYQDSALKITWVKRLLMEDNATRGWNSVARSIFPKKITMLFEGNLSEKDIVTQEAMPRNKFWQDVVKSWIKLNHSSPKTKQDVIAQPICYNSFIKINNNVIVNLAWYNKGIKQIKDIVNSNGNLLSLLELKEKYDLNINFLEYLSVISSIPKTWKTMMKNVDNTNGDRNNLVESIVRSAETSKFVYGKLSRSFAQFPTVLAEKWSNYLENDNIDNSFIENSFAKLYASTISTKIRNFQFKMIHRLTATNSKLCKWGLVESDRCDICNTEEETVKHLFCECRLVKIFWNEVRIWLRHKIGTDIILNDSEILLGTPREIPPIVDLIYTIGKMYIYWCKYQKKSPVIEVFESRVYNVQNIEKYIATKNNSIIKHNKKWFIDE